MNASLPIKKDHWLIRLFGGGGSVRGLQAEKARLEAFLTAFPGEYCGWSLDGSIAYSPELCTILGVAEISGLDDIQAALSPGDAAVLEGFFDRLHADGTAFFMTTGGLGDVRTLKISGAQGRDLSGENHYNVLWLEDITAHVQATKDYQKEIEAKESELTKFNDVLDIVPRPLWLRNERQNIIWCNDTYAEFLGRKRSEIIEEQKEIFGQLRKRKAEAPDDIPPGRSLAKHALKKGQTVDSRVHGVIKGKRMLLRISEMPLPDGKTTLGIAYNVTREEELETQLKRYKSSNQELLGQLRSAIAIYTADEKLEFYNSAFAELWDLEEQWLNTKPKLGDLMEKLRETRRLPEQVDFRRFKQSWLAMFTNLDPYDEMLHLPDGKALRMLVVPHSMGGLMMTFEDVTSRLALESSYNTLIAVQKETLDNLAEAVAVYGGDGRIRLWNPAFGRFWGLNPEDLEGSPHISTIVDKKKSFFKAAEWTARREELIAKGLDRIMHEGRLGRADGTLVDFTTVPLPDGGVLITYTDVTDSVRVENALREKAAALEAAERLKSDFLANVSYQLRTPLNAIMGFNEILDQQYFGQLNERQKDYTRDINEASGHLLSLINDILDLSTLEAGYMTLQRADTGLYKMLKTVEGLVADWAGKEDIKLKLKCAKNIGNIMVDERRLQQAIINVIRNAINFTQAGGEILLSATKKNEGIYISIKDNGVGIRKEDRQRIFEPFERAQTQSAKSRSKTGAGLGLSLVKNIVALHGGKVELESEHGKGTIVTLFIPFVSTPTKLKLPIGPKASSEKS